MEGKVGRNLFLDWILNWRDQALEFLEERDQHGSQNRLLALRIVRFYNVAPYHRV